jgi:ankyrin repeat protein
MQDVFEQTALFWAASNGHVGVVRVLLKHGADVNSRGMHGFIPLHAAAGRGHTEIVRLLLERSGDVTVWPTTGGFHYNWRHAGNMKKSYTSLSNTAEMRQAGVKKTEPMPSDPLLATRGSFWAPLEQGQNVRTNIDDSILPISRGGQMEVVLSIS